MNKKKLIIIGSVFLLLSFFILFFFLYNTNKEKPVQKTKQDTSIINIDSPTKIITANKDLKPIVTLKNNIENKKEKIVIPPSINKVTKLLKKNKTSNFLTKGQLKIFQQAQIELLGNPDSQSTNLLKKVNNKLDIYYNKELDKIEKKIIGKIKGDKGKVSFIEKIVTKRYISEIKKKSIGEKKATIFLISQQEYKIETILKNTPYVIPGSNSIIVIPSKNQPIPKTNPNTFVLDKKQKQDIVRLATQQIKDISSKSILAKIKETPINKKNKSQNYGNSGTMLSKSDLTKKVITTINNHLGLPPDDYIEKNNLQQIDSNSFVKIKVIINTLIDKVNSKSNESKINKYKIKTHILSIANVNKLKTQKVFTRGLFYGGTKKIISYVRYGGRDYDLSVIVSLKEAETYVKKQPQQYTFVYNPIEKIWTINEETQNIFDYYKLKYISYNNPELLYSLYLQLSDHGYSSSITERMIEEMIIKMNEITK